MKTGSIYSSIRRFILLIVFVTGGSAVRAGGPSVLTAAVPLAGPFPVRPFTLTYNRLSMMDARVNYQLACLAARIRMYPLAMRLFRHSLICQSFVDPDEIAGARSNQEDEKGLQDDQDRVLRWKGRIKSPRLSPQTGLDRIIKELSDTLATEHFAIMIQVKQPSFGRRRIFKGLGNVGHSFVTLIRFNRDRSYTSVSVGLYPRKNYPLAASPFFPVTLPVFRDDSQHDWDEMVGRYIPRKTYRRIMRLLETFRARKYSLNNNNCTDFALAVGDLSGLHFTETAGQWPFGHGNNPACLGQSILAGNISDSTAAASGEVLVSVNHDQ